MKCAQGLVHADTGGLVQVERDVVGGHPGTVAAEEAGILRRVWIARIQRIRKVEDVLIEERHLDICVRVVEVDRCLQRPAGNRYPDAAGKVRTYIVPAVIEPYAGLACRGGEGACRRVQI